MVSLHTKVPDWTKSVCAFAVIILVFIFILSHSNFEKYYLNTCDSSGCHVIRKFENQKDCERNRPNKNSYCTMILPVR